MGNTVKKILILAIVIILAIAGIMVFYPTIVAPPNHVAFEDVHSPDLEKSINGFSSARSYQYNDSVYFAVLDKIDIYSKEGFLDDAKIDKQKISFIQHYVPIFVDLCYKKFNASVWKESDHLAIKKRIKELNSMTIESGHTKLVAGSFVSDLENIKGIIDEYDKAKEWAKYSSFVSISDAKSKINKAESYRTSAYLKNCTDLVNKLANVKVNIGKSHYRYVESQVLKLRDYRNMTKEEFLALEKTVMATINEYENNKTMYGSSAQDITPVRNRAAEIHKEAMAFYERPEISIDTNGQWISMSSPSTSYRAYQSSSNWHKASTNATMTITIKGYTSFSFKIRSNGEANYDYVMVGALNTRPTPESLYASTKGSPSTGTSIYSYKDVSFSGLSKSTTYTIYVTYRKDSSGDNGEDRGYVLVPYVTND